MKDSKKKISIIKIIILLLLIIFVGIFSLSYKVNNNYNYNNKLIEKIKNNYSLNDNINYINVYGNYYIITTKDKAIVLTNKYKEVYKEDISKLAKNTNNYNLIYRKNKLMYENTIYKKNGITYEYYDIKNYKRISTTNLER